MAASASPSMRRLAAVDRSVAGATGGSGGGGAAGFVLEEATIGAIQAALVSGALSCVRLVELYLGRIKAYNGQSCRYPHGLLGDDIELVEGSGQLNALSTLNLRPAALAAWGLEPRKGRSLTDAVDDDPVMLAAGRHCHSLPALLCNRSAAQ